MQIALLEFAGEIRWRVSATDPQTYNISAFPGVGLVTPLIFSDLIRSRFVNDTRRVLGSLDGTWLLRTEGIALTVNEADVDKYRLQDGNLLLLDVAAALLDALRYFSKQAEMRTGTDHFASCLWLTLDDLPTPSQLFAMNLLWRNGWSIQLLRGVKLNLRVRAAQGFGLRCSTPSYLMQLAPMLRTITEGRFCTQLWHSRRLLPCCWTNVTRQK
jgi:hypothetical protein